MASQRSCRGRAADSSSEAQSDTDSDSPAGDFAEEESDDEETYYTASAGTSFQEDEHDSAELPPLAPDRTGTRFVGLHVLQTTMEEIACCKMYG